MKLYLICAVWSNTKKNHAGMLHLAKALKRNAPIETLLIQIPTRGSWYLTPFYKSLNLLIGIYLYFKVKPGDVVFLMEYLLPVCEQSIIARLIRNKAKVIGLAHLIPKRLDRLYTKKQLKDNVSYLDTILVLGTSLKSYLIEKGINPDKIKTTFHYVDTDYYTYLKNNIIEIEKLEVICMGNMERNYKLLSDLIERLPDVNFQICMGVADIKKLFVKYKNVTLHSFMEENELKKLMQNCDISLNIMNDTIGSNVIATSLSTGLVIVASNVGSISDYVTNNKNGILFNNLAEAENAINNLNRNRTKLLQMKKEAVLKAETMSIPKFTNWFLNFINQSK